MALILHLSDLHLVAPSASLPIGTHKAGLVPTQSRQTYQDVLKRTIRALAERLVKEGRRIDAVIMTGDIANQNNPEGYSAFIELVDALGDLRVAPNRVVVVPGNHDVAAGRTPGDPARYAEFVAKIRGARYVTPLLDGVDTAVPTGPTVNEHLLRLGHLEIVPINSSEYSQVRLDLGISDDAWDAALDAAVSKGGASARDAMRRLRVVDAARVTEKQLDAVRQMLAASLVDKTTASRASASSLRVAVIHHQLLPVSVDEEVKAFESLTNLGLLREFLRENEFAVLLHGHKHTPHSYTDYVVSYDAQGARDPHRVRVIAGPSPSAGSFDDQDVCRLLEFDEATGDINMEYVPAVWAGHHGHLGRVELLSVSRPGAANVARTDGVTAIEGRTAIDVYRALLATIRSAVGDGELENLVCRVVVSPTDEELAELYPGFAVLDGNTRTSASLDDEGADAVSASKVEQFKELVRWWQEPELVPVGDEPSFTHGSRILRYAGHLDQLANVVEALIEKPTTSRAVLLLLQPTADQINNPTREFPSFCFVQFCLRRGAEPESVFLDCIAYFRKQEMRCWWLVNVAELGLLQRRIADELALRAKSDRAWMKATTPGAITTIAARAKVGRSAPKVQVPKVDQYFATSRDRLVDMVHAIVWERMPERERHGFEWLRLMLDLIPPAEREADGVAIARSGVEYLATQVRAHLDEADPKDLESLKRLEAELTALSRENSLYASNQKLGTVSDQRHREWRAAVEGHVRRITELTYAKITARDVAKVMQDLPKQGPRSSPLARRHGNSTVKSNVAVGADVTSAKKRQKGSQSAKSRRPVRGKKKR